MPDEDGVTVETSRTYPCCVLKLSTLATIDIVPLMASRQPGGNSRDLFSDYDDFIDRIAVLTRAPLRGLVIIDTPCLFTQQLYWLSLTELVFV